MIDHRDAKAHLRRIELNRLGSPTQPAACARPPAGWACTRPAGHDGPCAAVPDETSSPAPEPVPPVRVERADAGDRGPADMIDVLVFLALAAFAAGGVLFAKWLFDPK